MYVYIYVCVYIYIYIYIYNTYIIYIIKYIIIIYNVNISNWSFLHTFVVMCSLPKLKRCMASYFLSKFQYQTWFPYKDIKQNAFLNFYLANWWYHKRNIYFKNFITSWVHKKANFEQRTIASLMWRKQVTITSLM